jgi:filamentous hemagglutinin
VDALGLQDWAYYAEEQVQRDVENAVAAREAAEALYAECYDPDDQNGDGLPDLTYTSGTSGGKRRSRIAPAAVVGGWIKNAWRRLRGGQETCKTAVGSNAGQGGQDNCGTPVKPGDRGAYSQLKSQKDRLGQTQPVEMHEMPSFAAKKKAFIQQYGRPPNAAEQKSLRDAGVSEAVTPDVHRQTRTYGGRNTPQQSASDAADLDAAQALDEADLNGLR